MANFTEANRIVSANEGGYQKISSDPGNFNSLGQNVGTNWGVNAKVYESHIGRPPTEQDMRSMSIHTAHSIFKLKYWDRIKGDQITNQKVANMFYDGAINHGVGLMSKFVQRIIGVPDDGVIGPISLAAINAFNPATLHKEMKERRRALYYDIVRRKPEMEMWLNGWLKRIDRFKDFFLQPDGTLTTTAKGGLGVGGALSIGVLLYLIFKK